MLPIRNTRGVRTRWLHLGASGLRNAADPAPGSANSYQATPTAPGTRCPRAFPAHARPKWFGSGAPWWTLEARLESR